MRSITMNAARERQSLQAVLDSGVNIVDRLYRNPPKNALTIFTQMMPGDAVRPEFTTWRDEQRSWREGVALHDQSYHMHSLSVRGKEALRLLEYLGVNSFATFAPGAAKQFLACSPEGYVIGDGILYYLEPQNLLLVGNPSTTDWVQFHGERGGFDVSVELDPMWALNPMRQRRFYRYQVEGPNAWKVLERLHGQTLPEIKFFRWGVLDIAGCQVRGMRHSMGGVPGLELSGPWDDRSRVKSAIVEAGREFGLRQIGSIAYFTTVIESGWWAVPVPAIYTSPEQRGYREWLTTAHAAARMSLGGSFYSPKISDYYATPWDIGHGHLVKFDHEFVGRAALQSMVNLPHRRKVTLVWHPEDVIKVTRALFQDGTMPSHLNFPLAATARLHYDKVLAPDGRFVGLAHYPGYTVNERAMLSLGSLEEAYTKPGTEVLLQWGEDGGGSRSAPWIEPHKQVNIRATVAPSPISQAAQAYRAVLK
jgi:vanillate/3-O-methylgallate O-demethylase